MDEDCDFDTIAAMLDESDPESDAQTLASKSCDVDESSDDDVDDDELDRLAALVAAEEMSSEQEVTSVEPNATPADNKTAPSNKEVKSRNDADVTGVTSATGALEDTLEEEDSALLSAVMQHELEDGGAMEEDAGSGDDVMSECAGAGGDQETSEEEEGEGEDSALRAQMRLMQEQMALLAAQLEKRKDKKKAKSSPRPSKSSAGDAGEDSGRTTRVVKDALSAVMATSPSPSPSDKHSNKSPRGSKTPTLKECNIFDIMDQEQSCGKGNAKTKVVKEEESTGSAPWERKKSVPSSGYRLSSSTSPRVKPGAPDKQLEAKLTRAVEKITKKQAASSPASEKTKTSSFYGNQGAASKQEKELFGSGSDSDWSDLDGEKNQELSVMGKEIKSLSKKRRVAHEARYDVTDLEKYRDRPKTSRDWKSPALGNAVNNGLSQPSNRPPPAQGVPRAKDEDKDTTTDPFSGIRIVKPLVSSNEMKRRMEGRRLIKLSHIHSKRNTSAVEGDWVTIGVIAHKGEPRMSQNNKQFSVWKLTDLEDCDQIVHLYLFGEVFKAHWKTVQGSVIGLLNPSIMKSAEKYSSRDAESSSLTLDDKMKLMLMGTSKDLGVCRARTKAGKPCTNYVNKKRHEFCSYHVQMHYKRMGARRGELSSSFTGVTPKSHEKQLFKNKNTTVIYGGKTYTSQSLQMSGVARKKKDNIQVQHLQSHAVRQGLAGGKVSTLTLHNLVPEDKATLRDYEAKVKDRERSRSSSGADKNKAFHELLVTPSVGSMNFVKHLMKKENMQTEEANKGQKVQSISAKELLQMASQSHKQASSRKSVPIDAIPASGDVTSAAAGGGAGAPALGRGLAPDMDLEFDMETPPLIRPSKENVRKELAKKKAVANVLAKGGIEKTDPNAVKGKLKVSARAKVMKRVAKDAFKDESASEPASKRSRLLGDVDLNDPEVQALLKKKSKHAAALTQEEQERQDAYFEVLEKKEAMEDQMSRVTKQKVTAVICKQCKYRAMSANQRCKDERHTLTYDREAYRRWFQCSACKHKCCTLDRFPTEPCSKCGSSSFVKSSMLYERKGPKLPGEELLLRGEERKYVNS